MAALAAINRGEPTWVTVLDGDTGTPARVLVEPDDVSDEGRLLVICKRLLWAANVVHKDGLKVWIRGRTVRIHGKDIRGRIAKEHGR